MNWYEDQRRHDVVFVPVCKQKYSSLEYRFLALIVIVGFSGVACMIVVYFVFTIAGRFTFLHASH